MNEGDNCTPTRTLPISFSAVEQHVQIKLQVALGGIAFSHPLKLLRTARKEENSEPKYTNTQNTTKHAEECTGLENM